MELYRIYRKNALRPWLVWGGLLAVAILYLLIKWRGDYTVIPLLLAVYLIPFALSTFKVWTGIGSKGFRAYAETHSEEDMRRLAMAYDNGQNYGTATLTEQGIILMSRQDLAVIPYEDLVWTYQVGRMSSFTGKHTYVTVACTKDRKAHNVDIKGKENDLRDYFSMIRKMSPGAFIGQDREVSRLYKKDFDALLAKVEERRVKSMLADQALPQEQRPAPEDQRSREEPAEEKSEDS